MPICRFYAGLEDLKYLIDDVVLQLDHVRLFERYSKPSASLREYRSFEEAFEGTPFMIDSDTRVNSRWLSVWPTRASPNVFAERFVLKQSGETKFVLRGWGLIDLHLGMMNQTGLVPSIAHHSSFERARMWASDSSVQGSIHEWDWEEVNRVSRKINYRITKFSSCKYNGRHVMPDAQNLLQNGFTLKLN